MKKKQNSTQNNVVPQFQIYLKMTKKHAYGNVSHKIAYTC